MSSEHDATGPEPGPVEPGPVEPAPLEPAPLEHGVRLVVGYDGTDFAGWQAQPGQRTVQETIEAAIDAMGLARSRLRGCSRTDSGVHAEGQVAAFAVDRALPERGWTIGLNGLLPDDVVIHAATPCAPRYDPRFDATRKLYRYLIRVGPTRDPLTRRAAWQLGPRFARRDVRPRPSTVAGYLDVSAMRDAAQRLLGTHDFKAFKAVADGRENTVRTIFELRVEPGYGGRDDVLAIEIEGNAFMKNMVRILVGTLVEVGRHRVAPAEMDALLDPSAHRTHAGPTAPAHGLCLVRIWLGRTVATASGHS
ncbi:MAG: tRNA pseudouridine(38-40) synthase TruA [Myxococcales bacterium]|nr:tRNA pseudouridine(38-40) synthase TruA [Myxococcales bacterium]